MISTAGRSGVESGPSQIVRIFLPATFIASCPWYDAAIRPSLYHDARRCPPGRHFARDFFPDAGGDVAEGVGVGGGRLGHGDRVAFVGGLADRQVERHLAEKIGAEAGGL